MRGATNKIVGYALAVTALVACPCHLAPTLPLALTFLGGTALGAGLTFALRESFRAVRAPCHARSWMRTWQNGPSPTFGEQRSRLWTAAAPFEVEGAV